jgi:hypothetical protein
MNESQFIKLIEDYLEKTGISATLFGIQAVKDPNFVHDIKAGRSCSLKMVNRIENHIKERLRLS